ncbi:MAG: glutamate-1-semialdehyde aminotransferase [Sphaerochaeta sp.]|jgi:hypothetical protein|uniref:glutamate-1-semialdehyde aminotransferase n=1 Tax=Sphaerochaeta sp. TaxID=1972642 RepID=UPI002FC929C4
MPTVVRARSFYVYDRYGVRYLDFFQNYGRAVLGHRPDQIQKAMKNTISRGLVSEYPSIFAGRLETLLATLFPDYPVIRVYADHQKALQVAKQVSDDALFDPASSAEQASRTVSYWRPFLGSGGADSVMLFPILPFPGSFVPQVVCLKEEACTAELPPSDCVSPLLLDLLIKTTASLVRTLKMEEVVTMRMNNPLQGVFETRGPYGLTGLSDQRYGEFALEALACKVIMPPSAQVPFIVPGEYTSGTIRPLLELARRYAAL